MTDKHPKRLEYFAHPDNVEVLKKRFADAGIDCDVVELPFFAEEKTPGYITYYPEDVITLIGKPTLKIDDLREMYNDFVEKGWVNENDR